MYNPMMRRKKTEKTRKLSHLYTRAYYLGFVLFQKVMLCSLVMGTRLKTVPWDLLGPVLGRVNRNSFYSLGRVTTPITKYSTCLNRKPSVVWILWHLNLLLHGLANKIYVDTDSAISVPDQAGHVVSYDNI